MYRHRPSTRPLIAILAVSLLVVAAAGVWPPVYTVTSGSMEPRVETGDVVVVVDERRTTPPRSRAGVVSARAARETGYRTLGGPGDVIAFQPHGDPDATPVLHRAEFWVAAGENWYDKADPAFVNADGCRDLQGCPAPHAGFVTKGDANPVYDQAVGISGPVRPGWIRGVAFLTVPSWGGRPSV